MILFVLFLAGVCLGSPSDFRTSINQVLKTLQEEESRIVLVEEAQRIRPKIITKYDFLRRDRSSGLRVPPPMVISTGLTVQEERKPKQTFESAVSRRGRNINFRSPRAKVSFRGLDSAVASAPVINGIRVPDDESDRTVHRNGRYINNVFVPNNEEPELREFLVSSEIKNPEQLRRVGRSEWSNENYVDSQDLDREGRKLPFNFNFESFYSGRKQDMFDAMALESRTNEVYVKPEADPSQYFLEETPDSLHSDRSPYTFQPADMLSRLSQSQASGVLPATNSDFEIKQHTYQMCPGCPTFQIPIPVPKSSIPSDDVINPYQQELGYGLTGGETQTKDESMLDLITNKIISTISPVINTARSWFDSTLEENSQALAFSDRLSSLPAEAGDAAGPLVFASVAAVGLGVATLLSSGFQLFSAGGSRQFSADGSDSDVINQLSDYNPSDLMCLPRHYCEKMKNKKSVLDEFKNTKKVGLWMIERLFDKDTVYKRGQEPFYNKCNLRECVFSLLT